MEHWICQLENMGHWKFFCNENRPLSVLNLWVLKSLDKHEHGLRRMEQTHWCFRLLLGSGFLFQIACTCLFSGVCCVFMQPSAVSANSSMKLSLASPMRFCCFLRKPNRQTHRSGHPCSPNTFSLGLYVPVLWSDHNPSGSSVWASPNTFPLGLCAPVLWSGHTPWKLSLGIPVSFGVFMAGSIETFGRRPKFCLV